MGFDRLLWVAFLYRSNSSRPCIIGDPAAGCEGWMIACMIVLQPLVPWFLSTDQQTPCTRNEGGGA